VRDYPDGPLGKLCQRRLVGELIDEARVGPADGLLVFHTSGYPSPRSRRGIAAATGLELPVLGWTLPESVAGRLNQEFGTGFVGHRAVAIDIEFDGGRVAAGHRERVSRQSGGPNRRPLAAPGAARDAEHRRWRVPAMMLEAAEPPMLSG
jgi:hypothetical protein